MIRRGGLKRRQDVHMRSESNLQCSDTFVSERVMEMVMAASAAATTAKQERQLKSTSSQGQKFRIINAENDEQHIVEPFFFRFQRHRHQSASRNDQMRGSMSCMWFWRGARVCLSLLNSRSILSDRRQIKLTHTADARLFFLSEKKNTLHQHVKGCYDTRYFSIPKRRSHPSGEAFRDKKNRPSPPFAFQSLAPFFPSPAFF